MLDYARQLPALERDLRIGSLVLYVLSKKLSEGASLEAVLQLWPQVIREDMYAALPYASDVMANENILVPKAS